MRGGVALTAGFMKELFGLEWQTSSKNITFLERALPVALVPAHYVVFSANTHGANWSTAAGVFGGGANGNDPRDHGRGMSGRVAYAPINDGLTLQFGASGAFREADKNFGRLHLQSRAEAHLADVNFVDSRTIRSVDSSTVLASKPQVLQVPLSLQSEYVRTLVNRSAGKTDLQFVGWYVYGGWFTQTTINRCLAQVVEMTVGDPRQTDEALITEHAQRSLAKLACRWTRERAVQRINLCKQAHIIGGVLPQERVSR